MVCTLGRRRRGLERLLASLRDLNTEPHEILIVDNNAEPLVAARVERRDGLRFVHEPRPGLDHARNRGVAEASGQIVAFVDDDCEVVPTWLAALRREFAHPDVDLVTGRVLAAELERSPQRWFEARFSFDRGPRRARFHRTDRDRPFFPAYPSHLGTGCNMALRRAVFDRIDGFDPALDMGSPVGGGGDIDLFAQVLDGGSTAVYTPHAVVRHHHRHRRHQAVRQFFGYGETVTALVTKFLLHRPGQRIPVLRFLLQYLRDHKYRLGLWARDRRRDVPLYLLLVELVGMLIGPLEYLRGRWGARRTAEARG